MKKPTLAQLKRRPALWFFCSDYRWRITYPDGGMDIYNPDGSWLLDRYSWHEHALKYYEFGGWI